MKSLAEHLAMVDDMLVQHYAATLADDLADAHAHGATDAQLACYETLRRFEMQANHAELATNVAAILVGQASVVHGPARTQ